MLNSPLFQEQQTVQNGVTVRLYQRALDKAFAQLPFFLGPVIAKTGLSKVLKSGGASYLACDFDYELGLRDGSFVADFNPPQTGFAFDVLAGNQLAGSFDINVIGSVQPYGRGSACGFDVSGGPTFSADGLSGTVSLSAALQGSQLVITEVAFNARLQRFRVDLGPISELLDLIDMHDTMNDWLRGFAEDIVNEMVNEKLPEALTALLRDKLNFNDSIAGVNFAIRPNLLSTTTNNLTLRMNSTIGPSGATECPASNCVEPIWPQPTAMPSDDDAAADGAASIGIGPMNQALWTLWRSGKLAVSEAMDAREVMGALIPGVPVVGQAELKVWTDVAPTLALNATADADLNATSVKATIKIVQGPGARPLDIALQTSLSARAILEITPPFLNGAANPEGNRIQFRLADFALGASTATYGPGSATLTEVEKQRLIDALILPLYRAKVGTIVIASSIVDFPLGDTRRAALNVLRKERVGDSLAMYFRFDLSPAGDTIAPTVRVTDVDGIVPHPVTREVVIGDTDAVVAYAGEDNLPELLPYMRFETSTDGTTWTRRDYLPAIKLSELSEGSNWLYVRGKDFGGNVSAPTSVKITVDTMPPSTHIITPPPAFVNGPNTSISFGGVDAGAGIKDFAMAVDGGAKSEFTSATSRNIVGLGEGTHTASIFARDKVNHVDGMGASVQFTVDLSPPRSSVQGARTGFVSPAGARFGVQATDNFSQPTAIKFSAKLTGPTCAMEMSTFDAMAMVDLTGCFMSDGDYVLEVKGQDQAGNVELIPSRRTFKVDGTLPTVHIVEKPALRTNDAVPRFVVAGTDNMTPSEDLVFAYRIRGLTEELSPPVTDPVITLDGLPSGDYVFEVVSLDYADNLSPAAVYAFSLDSVPPSTQLSQPMPQWIITEEVPLPLIGVDDRSGSDRLQYSIQIDGGEPRLMTLPIALYDIADGPHTVVLRAVDELGNIDPVGVHSRFNVDRTAPETVLEQKPSFMRQGSFRPNISGTDNLTPTSEMRYVYRITRNGKTTDWSAPALKEELVIPLNETGDVKLELAAMDNAGLIDSAPVKLQGSVRASSGCACSGSTSLSELAWILVLAAFVMRVATSRGDDSATPHSSNFEPAPIKRRCAETARNVSLVKGTDAKADVVAESTATGDATDVMVVVGDEHLAAPLLRNRF